MGWRKFIPYSREIDAAAGAVGVNPAFLAATIAQETGSTFSPFVVALPERSFGLGQLKAKYHMEHIATNQAGEHMWWSPLANLQRAAVVIADAANQLTRAGVRMKPLDHETMRQEVPETYLHWILLRQVYAKGLAGATQAFGPLATVTGPVMLDRTGVRAMRYAAAIASHPLLSAVWASGNTVGRQSERAVWEETPSLTRVFWVPSSLRGIHRDIGANVSRDFAAWADPILGQLAMRCDHGGRVRSLRDFVTTHVSCRPYEGWQNNPSTPNADDAVRLVNALICALPVLRRYVAGVTDVIGYTNTVRRPRTDDDERLAAGTPHSRGWAIDLRLPEVRDHAYASLPGAARTLRGWMYGPDLDAVGGVGVYSSVRANAMLHIDGRPRAASGTFSRWWDGYSIPVF